MAWEYLQEPAFQTRFGVVAAYLYNQPYLGTIVDMNCGENGSLLCHLDHRYFSLYIGNDTAIVEDDVCGNERFLALPDDKLLKYLKENVLSVDVFLHLGYGGRDISGAVEESPTEIESGSSIVSHFTPEIVILESVAKFVDYMLAGYCLENKGYKKVHQIQLLIGEYGFVGDRAFLIYKRIA